jgi:ATP-dependent Lon protease
MDVYLAFYPVRERLDGKTALEMAAILLGKPEDLPARMALAMSLLHGSWTIGRMGLAAHLRHLKDSISGKGWRRNLALDPALTDAAELDANPQPALDALSTVEAWTSEINADERGGEEVFLAALEGFAYVLSLQAQQPESRRILNTLLSLPSPSDSSARSGFRAPGVELDHANLPEALRTSLQAARHGVTGPTLFLPADGAGKMAVLQALLSTGFVGMGTTTGRFSAREEQQSNTPKSGEMCESASAEVAHRMRVFDRNEVIEALERMPQGGMFDDNKKQAQLMQVMANDSGERSLSQVESLDALDDLYQRFPHFSAVVDFVRSSLALAACGEDGRPAKVPPILLKGAPGTGKTYFAQELARVLGVAFIERDMSVTSEAFVINGMDSSWKNSKPGIVFDALVTGKQANPLILLNEVDKAQTTGNRNSPLAPMHALLEPTSASRFVDEFVPVPVDASQVIWVLTANDGHIPDPILSRLEVFEISEPTVAECKLIAQSVWKSICERTLPKGHGFPLVLNESLLERMSRVSPRVMRKALTHAASCAALAGRKFIQVEDLEASGKRYAPPARKSIGFVE